MFAHDQSEGVEASILMNFVRWREIHCLAALHVSILLGSKFGTWLVETITLFVSSNRTSNTFVTGVGRRILVEKKIRDLVTRFGS